jgi:hypothetical protein
VPDWRSFSLDDSLKLRVFFDEINQALPPLLIKKIGSPLQVKFIPIGREQTLPLEPSHIKGHGSLAQYRANLLRPEIRLNQLILNEILKGPQNAQTIRSFHQDYYRYAKALIIHEVSHAYDLGSSIMARLQSKVRTQGIVSSESQFLSIMGWNLPYFGWNKFQKNTTPRRSPDIFEFHDPTESFAVHMEFFLLDPEFKCRLPAVYHYLNKHFNHIPFPDYHCSINGEISVSNNSVAARNAENVTKIDLSRLYEVHYLLASQGENFVSHWGHSMFRLVMCHPDREEMGPKCLTEDVAEHLVISFRANIEDVTPNPWKLISQQSYPSQLFFLKFINVVEEYSKDELRDLVSVPLKLTEDQRKLLVYRAMEQLWTYRGNYTFFTNNCATESVGLLGCCSDSKSNCTLSAYTPTGIFQQIFKNNIAEERGIWDSHGNIKDQKTAEAQGYLFKSKVKQLSENFQNLQAALESFHNFTLDTYLRKSNGSERLDAFKSLVSSVEFEPSEKVKISSQFYVLESQILRMRKKDLVTRLGRTLLENEDYKNKQKDPHYQETRGYGIPTEQEALEMLRTPEAEEQTVNVNAWFPDEIKEIEKIEENLSYFLRAITRKGT